MEAPRVYRKGESFQSLSVRGVETGVLARISALRASLESGNLTSSHVEILKRACDDLLAPPSGSGAGVFWLRPHVLEEIDRVDDSQLGRYLFHRYRYDVFPAMNELDEFPPCVQIEPTSICNFRCVFCFQTDPLLTQRKELLVLLPHQPLSILIVFHALS